jgi:hypothetical protein
MLFTAFLIFLVFSTFSQSSSRPAGGYLPSGEATIIVNRLGTITIIFTLLLFYLSIDIVAISPGITLFNN